jgi:xylulose-5-phosphate/fructose-6-phosphate phosphoketolase
VDQTIPQRPEATTPDDALLPSMDLWWRPANYLFAGQIYLLDNPLLRETLTHAHIKRRLPGHFGTTPGLT